jgi:dihydropyrimidine dehydrogenase (NAD+) subunit PreT
MVIRAIGQKPYANLPGDAELLRPDGTLAADDSGHTARAGLFAGGDCVNGGKEVVDAVEAGKRAARSILVYLSTEAADGIAFQ